ncbi:MAG: signal recognition particle-docking protein FtsY [Rhodobacterales bacterium]|jgi:fused signal recognition particle receptor|nr:signal recognition particle-docking protein FtsY [Rhodobacterales bacterium]|tara:strand:- start:2610 stop:3815 length:1206 start_codon:yes stop_codon:yes gene_type:complete
MKFFRKLKEKLFSTSSKIKDGLEGIIDNQSIENVQEEQSKQDKLDKSLSQKINENFEQKKEKTLEESHKNNIKIDKTKSLVSVSNKSKELPSTVEKIQKTSSSKKTGIFSKIIKTVEKVTKKRKLDDKMLNEIEDLLISSDIGVSTASLIVEKIKKENFSKELDIKQLKQLISDEIYEIMNVSDSFLKIKEDQLNIWLFVGVNGSGKTTTIGKIAKQEKDNGKKVILAAADTFRAAAVDQLSIWSKRVGIEMVKGEEKSDPASVVYKAIEEAKKSDYDLLLIDTAGRLQNKTDLMQELEKIIRVIKKQDPSAPHNCLIVLDATTGQNVISQVEVFLQSAGLTGIIMTKLDGTARGGVLVAVTKKFNLPIYRIGLGEKIEDLETFDPKLFSRVIVGLDNNPV